MNHIDFKWILLYQWLSKINIISDLGLNTIIYCSINIAQNIILIWKWISITKKYRIRFNQKCGREYSHYFIKGGGADKIIGLTQLYTCSNTIIFIAQKYYLWVCTYRGLPPSIPKSWGMALHRRYEISGRNIHGSKNLHGFENLSRKIEMQL